VLAKLTDSTGAQTAEKSCQHNRIGWNFYLTFGGAK
jgi:hypothetical protein